MEQIVTSHELDIRGPAYTDIGVVWYISTRVSIIGGITAD